jgi:hypothetical protein
MDGEYKIVPETSVQLIDRQFVHGEIVKSLERKQSGVIIDVRVTLELLHEHSKATLRGVDACKVTHLYPVTKGLCGFGWQVILVHVGRARLTWPCGHFFLFPPYQ